MTQAATSNGLNVHKDHFAVLDGLRGVAAVMVVILHISQQHSLHSLPMAALAVDFFYVLSGFVIAFAYEQRLKTGAMGFRQFMVVRAIRLYPLIFVGVSMGIVLAALSAVVQGKPSLLQIGEAGLLGLVLLPCYVFPQWPTAYPFNMAVWSMFFEVWVNVVYAVIAKWLSNRVLIALVVASAFALVALVAITGTLEYGFNQAGWAYGFIRVMFPFFAGVLIFRFRPKLRSAPLASIGVAVALVVVLGMPLNIKGPVLLLTYVLFLLPLIVVVGSAVIPGPKTARAALFAGQLSYPIYILHAPMLRISGEIKDRFTLSPIQTWGLDVFMFFVIVVSAYLALKLFDEPVRKWLTAIVRRSRPVNVL